MSAEFNQTEFERKGIKFDVGAPVIGAVPLHNAIAVSFGDGTVRFFRYGEEPHVIKAHNGVDYAAKRNTPVMASGDGVISFVGYKSGYGRTVEIKHGGNIKTLYAHLERFNAKTKVGNKVKQGEIIAYVGDSGQATGTHLHFEFWQGKIRTDPVKVELPSAKSVTPSQMKEFKNLVNLNLEKLSEYNFKQDE